MLLLVALCRCVRAPPCREVELQRSLLTAQLAAQSAALQQERELLASQRLNSDMLVSLSEQVGPRALSCGALGAKQVCRACRASKRCCMLHARPPTHARTRARSRARRCVARRLPPLSVSRARWQRWSGAAGSGLPRWPPETSCCWSGRRRCVRVCVCVCCARVHVHVHVLHHWLAPHAHSTCQPRARTRADTRPQLSSRELELSSLKASLSQLLGGLECRAEAEAQVAAGASARLAKEAARLEALQVGSCCSVCLHECMSACMRMRVCACVRACVCVRVCARLCQARGCLASRASWARWGQACAAAAQQAAHTHTHTHAVLCVCLSLPSSAGLAAV
jgi:hypothetical protein